MVMVGRVSLVELLSDPSDSEGREKYLMLTNKISEASNHKITKKKKSIVRKKNKRTRKVKR